MGRLLLRIALLLAAASLVGCARERAPVALTPADAAFVRAVALGMSRHEVMELPRMPDDISPRPSQAGLCHDYSLGEGNLATPYFVSFDGDYQVDGKGFSTCREKARKPSRGRY